MLYLEDYLEMIEHLPQELRDRFTEMRELDLAVQNNMDSLDKKSRLFFQQCKRGELQHESMDTEFHCLRREYYKVMEDADEKVAIATQIHELVERYLRRLDSELFKFKCELEADNNGITEILEKRSLELDGNNSTAATALLLSINQKERYYNSVSNSSSLINSAAGIISSSSSGSNSLLGSNNSSNAVHHHHHHHHHHHQQQHQHQRQRKLEKRRETICTVPVQEKRPNLNQSLPVVTNSTATSNLLPVNPTHLSISSHSHVTLPTVQVTSATVTGTVVRQLGTNLSVLATNSGSSNTNSNTNVTAVAVAAAAPHVSVNASPNPGPTTVTYNLQQLGSGTSASSAIAAAASQAIVATQQMPQGRRTASLKASYEAIHGASVAAATEFWPTTATHTAGNHMSIDSVELLTTAPTHTSLQQQHSSPHISHHTPLALNPTTVQLATNAGSTLATAVTVPHVSNVSAVAAAIGLPASALAPGTTLAIGENGLVVEQPNEAEWSYDPNEPRYCTCNQVSYGDMVACDNDACPFEWFHYPCVGITQPPKGKWYCPKCTSMRRRGNRKN
ncbi:Ing3 [Drosophila busckii]|uniref:Inhibitor of growth protein n=1 Tax=Drosophila busckii TaxID=30019 RepID=A0A0M3QZ16_DROBS|nr:Ing3 [Drosophila busckii]